MKTFLLLSISFSLGLSVSAVGDSKEFYYRRFQERQVDSTGWAAPLSTVKQAIFEQRIDPQNPGDKRTFKQRYYVDDSYAKGPEAPVFFVLCGEAVCSGRELGGAVASHARAQGAYLFALEHRYYGKSQPFDRLSTENLKYLSTDNALLDAEAFQTWAQGQYKLAGKWIVIGGSYPGSLSAYYRLKFPKLVVGSLASSAPVEARANFEEYDRHVATVAGPVCGTAMKKVVSQVEAALTTSQASKEMRNLFGAEALVEDDDFLYLIADMGALAIQYGYRDHFCKLITGPDPLKGYADFTKEIYASWQMNAVSGSVQGAMDEDPNVYADGIGSRQWFYQSCTEYGYWQNAFHDAAQSVRSARINPEYHRNACKRMFGIEVEVNTEHINQTFYQPLLKNGVDHILFTNGEQDPWSKLSINTPTSDGKELGLNLYTIKGAAHCDDLRAPKAQDSESLKGARKLFGDLVAEWLKP